mgnify:CR=1 FL=1
MRIQSCLTHLECPECGATYDSEQVQTYCQAINAGQPCRSPLLARYHLSAVQRTLTPSILASRSPGVWRWAELLPVRDPHWRLTLGEGSTPLLSLPRTAARLGLDNLFLKDEALNPTGSFKARGLVVAVSKALELGVRAFVIPTAGNAGGALAAYCARAGHSGAKVEAHVFMPKDAPRPNIMEVKSSGADLRLVDGLINDAARLAAAEAAQHGWFDVSTFKEPYRVEGKKTMGLELAEQFNWDLPDVIIYPTGGGTGLAGMWKAFDELEQLGWIGSKRPRMVTVQADGCAPIVKAFHEGKERAEVWQNAATLASGLRVPAAFADRLILRAIRASHGTALSVSDDDILRAQDLLARQEGIFSAPEGAATLAALEVLIAKRWVKPEEKIVLYNTGSGLKYI